MEYCTCIKPLPSIRTIENKDSGGTLVAVSAQTYCSYCGKWIEPGQPRSSFDNVWSRADFVKTFNIRRYK